LVVLLVFVAYADTGRAQERDSASLSHDAVVALEAGRYDEAIDLLRIAIKSNPGDVGADYTLSIAGPQEEQRTPAQTDAYRSKRYREREHGRAQLEGMLADLPGMSRYLLTSDDICKWAAGRFSMRVCGTDLEWDSSEVSIPVAVSEYTLPREGVPATIRVEDVTVDDTPDGRARAFETLWRRAVFELHNVQSASQVQRTANQALLSRMSEEDYARSMFEIELKAVQRTRRWYVEMFLPHAKKYQLPTRPANWYCNDDWWGSAESLSRRFAERRTSFWALYLDDYRALKNEDSN
jgi:hypothetical protein